MATDQKIQYIDNRDFTGGLNTIDDPINLKPSETPYCLNMDITKNGAMITRYGYELVSSVPSVSGGCQGILPYYRTYDDTTTVDQSLDSGAAYGQTYTVPLSTVSEAAADKQTFTPIKTGVAQIAVYVVAKGTTNLQLTLHDASNNILAQPVISNANMTTGWNYFPVPYTWSSGALHFHLTCYGGAVQTTVKTQTLNDLETASFIETYSNKGDYLIFFHNANAYYITNASSTATLIGSLGTTNGAVRGIVFNNYAIYSNGLSDNIVKKWNGATQADIVSAPRGKNFGILQQRLFSCGSTESPSTVSYSKTADETTWATPDGGYIGINIGDGENCTGLINNNDFLVTMKDNSIYAINFNFDSSYNLTIPQLQPIVASNGGCVATGTLQAIYGYTFYLSKNGFETYGPNPQRIVADMPLPLSLKIDPTIKNINLLQKDNFNSVFWDNKYMCAVATGNSSVNNYIFIYNENIKRRFGYDNWTLYSGIPAQSFARFRDANKVDRLYFVSTNEPNLYRFNTSFSDNGFGYDRLWRSKTFQFGTRTYFKYIDIYGSMTQNSTIFVDVNTDGIQDSANEITSANLLQSTTGGTGYIADNNIGDIYTGNSESTSETTPMYKFFKRLYLSPNTNTGNEMWFQLRNNAEGQGWKITRYVIAYMIDPQEPTIASAD